MNILHYFLSRHHNQRSDEYGGSPRNRVRLLEEILVETREAGGDTGAVPCRISTNELLGPAGLERAEVEEMIGFVAEVPELWDVALAAWERTTPVRRVSALRAGRSRLSRG